MARSIYFPAAYNQAFNVGADVPYSVNELAREVQVVMGRDTGIVHLPARKEVLNAFSDHSKSREVFGTGESITLAEGLRRMAEWVKKTGVREGKPFDKIEVERELPESWRRLCTTAKL
jgi:UDP-glucose 4-epimerase